jgi:hypothetical protein
MGKTFKRHNLDYEDDSDYSDYRKTSETIREKRKKKLEKQQHIGEDDDNSDYSGER